MSIQGLIFDCDGTLVDSMPPHYEAWLATLQAVQLTLDEDRFYAMGGWPTLKVAQTLVAESNREIDPFELAHLKEQLFEQEMLHRVTPIEAVVQVVRAHYGRLPLAIATGGLRRICEGMLKPAGLLDYFDTMVTCEDVERHKPEPDVFLEAARRIGVRPENCCVYEDTDPGIEGARRAGMTWVDVRLLHKPRRVSSA